MPQYFCAHYTPPRLPPRAALLPRRTPPAAMVMPPPTYIVAVLVVLILVAVFVVRRKSKDGMANLPPAYTRHPGKMPGVDVQTGERSLSALIRITPSSVAKGAMTEGDVMHVSEPDGSKTVYKLSPDNTMTFGPSGTEKGGKWVVATNPKQGQLVFLFDQSEKLIGSMAYLPPLLYKLPALPMSLRQGTKTLRRVSSSALELADADGSPGAIKIEQDSSGSLKLLGDDLHRLQAIVKSPTDRTMSGLVLWRLNGPTPTDGVMLAST